MDDAISKVSESYKKGNLSRREAVKSLLQLGLTAPIAYTTLGVMGSTVALGQVSDNNFAKLDSKIDPYVYISEQSKLLAEIAASPLVQKKLLEVQKADIKEKANLSLDLMKTIQSLPILQDNSTNELRLSLRVFENENNRQNPLGFGEVSRQGLITAKSLRELNSVLVKAGVGPSVAQYRKNPNTPEDITQPITGLYPPIFKIPVPYNPRTPILPNTPINEIIPRRVGINPQALTICGSMGVVICVSVGG